MARRKTVLPIAAVARIAHVKDGIRVQKGAIELAIADVEASIKDLFNGAYQFTEHRGGTMIMKKDVEAYLASIQ